jgi:hypothetical protein
MESREHGTFPPLSLPYDRDRLFFGAGSGRYLNPNNIRFRGEADIGSSHHPEDFAAFDPICDIGRIKFPQCSDLLRHVLSIGLSTGPDAQGFLSIQNNSGLP